MCLLASFPTDIKSSGEARHAHFWMVDILNTGSDLEISFLACALCLTAHILEHGYLFGVVGERLVLGGVVAVDKSANVRIYLTRNYLS